MYGNVGERWVQMDCLLERLAYYEDIEEKLINYFIETIFKDSKHENFCILTNEDVEECYESEKIKEISKDRKDKQWRIVKQRLIK